MMITIVHDEHTQCPAPEFIGPIIFSVQSRRWSFEKQGAQSPDAASTRHSLHHPRISAGSARAGCRCANSPRSTYCRCSTRSVSARGSCATPAGLARSSGPSRVALMPATTCRNFHPSWPSAWSSLARRRRTAWPGTAHHLPGHLLHPRHQWRNRAARE